ncbi:MAG: Crp/Fnr family transcriptional regulator [Planctomycetota bacterium]|jgi:CRP-like cAMP-binding protein
MTQTQDDKRKALLAQMQCRASKGDIIFKEGDTTREMYILLAGSLEIKRGEQVIAVVKEKDTYLGEMSTLLGLPRTATVAAAEEALLVKIPEEKVSDFFNHSPALALKLSKILATRLHEMNEKHQRLLKTIGTPEYDSIELFERLICTEARKTMMKLVSKGNGVVPLEKLTKILNVSSTEADRIYTDYEFAKLIKIENENIQLLKPENQDLMTAINNYSALNLK